MTASKIYMALVIIIFIMLTAVSAVRRDKYEHLKKDYTTLKEESIAKDKEISTLKAMPSWYISAYKKCSTQQTSEEFLRQCIAFEIKELHH